MVVVDLDPVLSHIGPLAISWYGLAIVVAAAAALWLTVREARRKGIPTDALGDLAIWIVIGSLVGARLLHVVERWADHAANPAQTFAVHNGGPAILGALLGGFLAGGIAAQQQGLRQEAVWVSGLQEAQVVALVAVGIAVLWAVLARWTSSAVSVQASRPPKAPGRGLRSRLPRATTAS